MCRSRNSNAHDAESGCVWRAPLRPLLQQRAARARRVARNVCFKHQGIMGSEGKGRELCPSSRRSL
eukprot:6422282-Alexandrium_andersonii.AAC.1